MKTRGGRDGRPIRVRRGAGLRWIRRRESETAVPSGSGEGAVTKYVYIFSISLLLL
jgi:hypothetical protein